MSTEEGVPTPCKICANIIFVEDHAVHFNCITTREKSLVEMVSFLRDQLDSMKKAFNSMNRVMKNLDEVLYLTNVEGVFAPDPPQQMRSVRPSTREQSLQLSKNLAAKKVKGKPSNNNVSPLAVPNGTTDQQQVNVTQNSHNQSTITVHPSSRALNPATSSSSSSLNRTTDDGTVGNSDVQLTASSVASDVQQTASSDSPEAVCGITVVPPPKSIFLSRLGLEVTEGNVVQFIKTKIPTAGNFHVRKMRFRDNREYSSFEITIRNDINLFNSIISPELWPALTVVKEFTRFLKAPRVYNDLT